MGDLEPEVTLAELFRRHAGDEQHLYGHVIRAMAKDWESDGPVRQICAGYEDAPAAAVVQLRLLAGVFRLVLTGQAPQLERFYPCLSGSAPPEQAWPVMREVITDHAAELREALEVAPQTNEVGRSAPLLVGLLDLARTSGRRRIRLLEVGASAGLNLLIDQYAIVSPGRHYGPSDSPVQLSDAVQGDVAGWPGSERPLEIVDRRGCDLHPVDPTTADGRLLLTSFVWPFDLHRHRRLAAAFEVVDRWGPAAVDAASASVWLERRLASTEEPDVLTVVWHSITQQYWPSAEISQMSALLAARGADHCLGQVSMEFRPEATTYEAPELRTTFWPGDGTAPVHRLVGTAHHHGIPVRVLG